MKSRLKGHGLVEHDGRRYFISQESGELLILFEERISAVSAEDVMAVLDLFERRIEFASGPPVDAGAEDIRDLVGGHAPEFDLTAALEDPVDRKVT